MTGDYFIVQLMKHPRMQDVAMEILSLEQTSSQKMRLNVSWWNIGKCHAPYPMAVFQEFEVPSTWVQEIEVYEYKPR